MFWIILWLVMPLVHDTTGSIHLGASVAAVVLGSLVLAQRKGTRVHKLTGYFYVASMVILNGSAMNSYHLFGKWGPFHYGALLSVATLMMGFLPAFFRAKNWIHWHVAGMYYSVIGLYAALISEIATRVPGTPFFPVVIGGTALVIAMGIFLFNRKRKGWILTPTQVQSSTRKHINTPKR